MVILNFQATLKDFPSVRSTSWTTNSAKSPSNSYIQVKVLNKTLTPGDMATVYIDSNVQVDEYKLDVIFLQFFAFKKNCNIMLQIVSRDVILESVSLTTRIYRFRVTNDMQPSFYIVVSFVKDEDKEIVADSLQVYVKPVLQNHVKLSYE